jgi:4-diphosphocytidyl-2-C-methyl-D-erythritol kinase
MKLNRIRTFDKNTETVIKFSPAKINIGLQILQKRQDGFHDIASLMYQIPLTDIIEIILEDKGTGFRYTQSGMPVPGELESNLCFKAWKLFSEECKIPSIKVHLHKRIPMGAGLGGGSSNAAAILKGMNESLGSPLSNDKLLELASQLGSDCSLFIGDKPAIARGRGEILEEFPLDLSGLYLVLLNPGIEVNTSSAYKNVIPDDTRYDIRDLLFYPMHQWKDLIVNDFEVSVFSTHPEIGHLKAALYEAEAIYASMTGSGSSVYGIFEQKPALPAKLAAQVIYSSEL